MQYQVKTQNLRRPVEEVRILQSRVEIGTYDCHPTSTNVERLFSTAGNVVKGRGRLKPENVEKLVFLKENLNLNNFKLDW